MSFLAKVSTFFGLEDEDYMEEELVAPQPVIQKTSQPQNTFKPRVSSEPKMKEKTKARTTIVKQTQTQSQPQPKETPVVNRTSAQTQTTVRATKPTTTFERPVQNVQTEKREKVVPIQSTPAKTNKQSKQSITKELSASKILIVEPRVYSEAMNIAKHVMSGESVLVNFHLIEEFQARRIVDFLTGTVYAEDGDIKRVADEIFLCTPKGTEIDGTAKSLVDENMFDI